LNVIDEKNISFFLHEIRSPISSLLGVISQTNVDMNSIEVVKDSFDKIKSIASYLLSLSNNYLEVMKSENSFFQSEDKQFNLNDVVNYVVDIAKFQFSSKGIKFETNLDMFKMPFLGDQIKIKQILINLLSNAFKYTPNFGEIYFECKQEFLDVDVEEITVKVKDNGIGMSKEYLRKLFTPYKTESNLIKPKGTGLGLYIVLDNIKKLNGTINVDSKKGEGTCFTAKIPLKISNIEYDLRGKKYLIIDDCSISQTIIKNFLESAGATCDLANDGEEGLKKFFESPILYYEAIVIDKKLKNMNGDEVACLIRSSRRKDAKKVKIIAISASMCNSDINHCLSVGVNDYLLKPLSKDRLLQSIIK